MKVDWKAVGHIAAQVTESFVPGAIAIEQGVENIAGAKTGSEKQEEAVKTALLVLQSAAKETGKDFATPRVLAAIRRLNDDSVELLNALAAAHTHL